MLVPAKPKLIIADLLSANRMDIPVKGNNLYFTRRGRDALFMGIPIIGLRRGDSILVPGYICKSFLLPLIIHGVECIFYDVNSDLQVNLFDIERKLTRKVKALLVVHYFGFPQDIKYISEVCKHNNIKLIEDCAHMFTVNASTGSHGDIAIYSLRKILPVTYGGILADNAVDATVSTYSNRLEENMSGLIRLGIEKIIYWIGSPNIYRMKKTNGAEESSDSMSFASGEKPSFLTSKIIASYKTISARRRVNYNQYCEALDAIKMNNLSHVIDVLPDSAIPMGFPLRSNNAMYLVTQLRNAGIGAYMWPGKELPDLHDTNCGTSIKNANEIILLPLHQHIEVRHIEYVIDTMKEMQL